MDSVTANLRHTCSDLVTPSRMLQKCPEYSKVIYTHASVNGSVSPLPTQLHHTHYSYLFHLSFLLIYNGCRLLRTTWRL